MKISKLKHHFLLHSLRFLLNPPIVLFSQNGNGLLERMGGLCIVLYGRVFEGVWSINLRQKSEGRPQKSSVLALSSPSAPSHGEPWQKDVIDKFYQVYYKLLLLCIGQAVAV